jgi:hypothetical protein
MQWDAIGAIGEVMGGFAVIASIMYLAVQIRQSRKLELATTIRDLHQKGSDVLRYTTDHPGTFEILRKGVVDYVSLANEEKEVFNCWGTTVIITVEQTLLVAKEGLLPENSVRAFEGFSVALITSTGGGQWWERQKMIFTTDLREHLDEIVVRADEAQPGFYDVLPHWRLD